jgi:hypothetical protein
MGAADSEIRQLFCLCCGSSESSWGCIPSSVRSGGEATGVRRRNVLHGVTNEILRR